METIFKIADINISVNMPFEYNTQDIVLENFIENASNIDVNYNFKEINKNIIFKSKHIYDNAISKVYNENGKYYREFYFSKEGTEYACLEESRNSNNYNCYIYPNSSWVYKKNSRLILRSLALEVTLLKFNAFMLHSSFIKWNNNGILFSGPSGIGKSTQANLWKEFKEAKIINGDRTILRKLDNKWMAYGSPYAGSSEIYLNEKCELKSIVLLKQSNENNVIKLDKSNALKEILKEATINQYDIDFYMKIIDLVEDIVENIPIYLLECKPDEDAVNALEKYMV